MCVVVVVGGVTQYSFAAALSVSYAEGLRATHISNRWCSTVACLEAGVHFMGYHFFYYRADAVMAN